MRIINNLNQVVESAVNLIKHISENHDLQQALREGVIDAGKKAIDCANPALSMLYSEMGSISEFRTEYLLLKLGSIMNGVDLSMSDRAKLCDFVTEQGNKPDNALRLLHYIDDIDTSMKLEYVTNATRALLMSQINAEQYFRILQAIEQTLDEDLDFLGKKYSEKYIEVSDNDNSKNGRSFNAYVQGLVTSGLMRQTLYTSGRDQRYDFTGLAGWVDKYAVNRNNEEKYSINNLTKPQELKEQPVKVKANPQWTELPLDSLDDMPNDKGKN